MRASNGHGSRLDRLLPAMVFARNFKDRYGGAHEPERLDRLVSTLLFGSPNAESPAPEGPSADRLPPRTLPRQGDGQGPVLDDAFFAACAFIDECFMNSQWVGRARWLRFSLARRYFGSSRAGLEFFDRLNDLLKSAAAEPRPAAQQIHGGALEALEVYGAALAMGFVGRYFDQSEAQLLNNLRDDVYDALDLPYPELPCHWPDPSRAPAPPAAPGRGRRLVPALLCYGLPALGALAILLSHHNMLAWFTKIWTRILGG